MGGQPPPPTFEAMPNFPILEHSSNLPHKQSFKVALPGMVSETELVKLTKQMASMYRIGSELMFFNWWTETQDIQHDACWACSKCENDAITVQFNTDSLDKRLESIETRPLHVDGELGIWYWNRWETSHFIHIIPSGNDTVNIHTVFSDGSNAWTRKKLKSSQPLEFLWSDEDDEDQVFFQSNEKGTVLRSGDGTVTALEKIRLASQRFPRPRVLQKIESLIGGD